MLYGHHFTELNNKSDDLIDKLGSLKPVKARYISFKFLKPIMACTETSMNA